jgi:hypothetical protein
MKRHVEDAHTLRLDWVKVWDRQRSLAGIGSTLEKRLKYGLSSLKTEIVKLITVSGADNQ